MCRCSSSASCTWTTRRRTSAQAWVSVLEVWRALESISTGTEVTQTVLSAARPAGGVRISHATELLKLADEAAALKIACCSNKGLVVARLLTALEHDLDEALPVVPTYASDVTKKIFEGVRRSCARHTTAVTAALKRLRMARQRGLLAAEARELASLQMLEDERGPRFTTGINLLPLTGTSQLLDFLDGV